MSEFTMEPTRLDPEVKWRSMISLFLNYAACIEKILSQELNKEIHNKIRYRIETEFWIEQAQAFIDLFALKPGNIMDAHTLKRIAAVLLDIKYTTAIENDDEIIDEMEYQFCPVRTTLKPVFVEVCDACEPWGQLLCNQLDPNFKHKVEFTEDICRHRTTRKKRKS